MFFYNFIANFCNPTITSDHIFDILMVDIETEVYFIQYRSEKRVLNHFMLVIVLGYFNTFFVNFTSNF